MSRIRARRKAKQKLAFKVPFPVIAVVLITLATTSLYFIYQKAIRPAYNLAMDKFYGATVNMDLQLNEIFVEGRNFTEQASIMHATNVKLGDPILAIDLHEIRHNLEKLYWIKHAAVERHLPGTLIIKIQERVPFALWQNQGQLKLIDEDGNVIAAPDISHFVGLKLVVGENAPLHSSYILSIIKKYPDIFENTSSAVWVGERRWNLNIYDNILVKLPENGIEAAMEKLNQLNLSNNIQEQHIELIDLRVPEKIYIKRRGEV